MNQWPFIIAAYGIVIAGTAGLSLWSYATMRRAERRAEAVAQRREPTAR